MDKNGNWKMETGNSKLENEGTNFQFLISNSQFPARLALPLCNASVSGADVAASLPRHVAA